MILVTLVIALSAVPLFAAQEDEARKVLDAASPSVVAIANLEGHGSGMLLDEKGLILTNAHVVASPLPYQVHVEAGPKDAPRHEVYSKVTVVGVHPTWDLALIRIDPQEHRATLRPVAFADRRPAGGELIFTLGFPLNLGKTITIGSLRVARRVLNDLSYLEVAAPVFPGNSGGPLLDGDGKAVGVMVFRVETERATGLAIPLTGIAADQFVPWNRRGREPGQAAAFVEAAQRAADRGNLPEAVTFYHNALARDFGNPDLYAGMGRLYRRLGREELAAAYLVRSLQRTPWAQESLERYRELGHLFLRLGRRGDALLVWQEAAAKFPDDCGRVWDDLAQLRWHEKEYPASAYASRVALRLNSPQGPQMSDLHKRARALLSPEQERTLLDRQIMIDEDLKKGKELSVRTRLRGEDFMTEACGKLIREFEGVQLEVRDASTSIGGWFALHDRPISPEEIPKLFTRTRILVAHELLGMGIRDRAVSALQDLLLHFPERPEAWEVRGILSELKKKEE